MHDEQRLNSPSGHAVAIWKMEGCHGLLSATNFDSTVEVRKKGLNDTILTEKIFVSDGSDRPQLVWNGEEDIRIQLDNIEEVYRSEREALGIKITYGVSRQVLINLKNEEERLLRPDAALENLTTEDRAAAERSDRDYKNSILKFRGWVTAYASAPAP